MATKGIRLLTRIVMMGAGLLCLMIAGILPDFRAPPPWDSVLFVLPFGAGLYLIVNGVTSKLAFLDRP